MKRNLIILVSIITVFVGCKTQNTVIRSNDDILNVCRILQSKGISVEVDSLINNDFKDINSQLQTSKTRSQIEELISGTWDGSFTTRSNGKDKAKIKNSRFGFSSSYNFTEITDKGTLTGEYLIEIDSTSNLVLIYDEPQYLYPEEMLAKMTNQEKEQTAYQIRFLNIFEINSENLIFYSVLPIFNHANPTTITHSRLILEQYVKK